MSNKYRILDSVDFRVMRGSEIAVRRCSDTLYEAQSQVDPERFYLVERFGSGWCCTCPDSSFRGMRCKHVYAVESVEAMDAQAAEEREEEMKDDEFDLDNTPVKIQFSGATS